jgi:hypothetical protein
VDPYGISVRNGWDRELPLLKGNVGRKTLQIAISVIGADGTVLFVAPAAPVAPATVASGDFSTTPNVTDGYCKFDVHGTGNSNQVRAILNANVLRTIPGTMTLIFLAKILEAR